MRPTLRFILPAVFLTLPVLLPAQEKARFATLQEALRAGAALAGGSGPRNVNWIDGGRCYSNIVRFDSGEKMRDLDPATGMDSLLFLLEEVTFAGFTELFAFQLFL